MPKLHLSGHPNPAFETAQHLEYTTFLNFFLAPFPTHIVGLSVTFR